MATPRKKPEDKLKSGRPTDYCPEMVELICKRVATNTCGLKKLCEMYPDIPVETTIQEWRYLYPEFSMQYAAAKMKQAELLAEECLDISDDGSADYRNKEGKKGEVTVEFNSEHVQRSRLRVDTRKWLAAKLVPKIYGEQAAKALQLDNNSHESDLRNLG